MLISLVVCIDIRFVRPYGCVDPVAGKCIFIKAHQPMDSRRAPSNKGMEPTINNVTPYARAKAAPLLLAADPRRWASKVMPSYLAAVPGKAVSFGLAPEWLSLKRQSQECCG